MGDISKRLVEMVEQEAQPTNRGANPVKVIDVQQVQSVADQLVEQSLQYTSEALRQEDEVEKDIYKAGVAAGLNLAYELLMTALQGGAGVMSLAEYIEQLLARTDDLLSWQIKGVVESEEITEGGKTYARIPGGKHLYEKQDDEYVTQWCRFEDDFYGFLLVPLEGSKYLHIHYEC